MADERYTFAQARTRLEEIVVHVRKKDCSLEKSLDLLEEGVRLANTCTELSDHAEWPTVLAEEQSEASGGEAAEGIESVEGAGSSEAVEGAGAGDVGSSDDVEDVETAEPAPGTPRDSE